MALWIREATLVIGHNKYSLAGLNFSFEIPFEDSDEPPVATLKVTNLAPNTRANIKRNDPVILNAGYEGDVGCILIGKVVGLKNKQSNVDWTSTLTVQPCADEILGSLVNKTYSENITASAMVRDLLNIFGVEVAKCELTIDQSYPRGRVCRGNMKQVLTEIIVNECNSRFIIRPTGQVYVTKSDDGINTGVLLTPSLGLLRSDEEKVAIPLETDKENEEDEDSTISRSCLLNYRIGTAEVVKIQSSDLNGRFLVVKGKHSGGRTGNWKTDMELKPFTPPVAPATSLSGGGASPDGGGSYVIGDIVNFTGSRHYVSSTGDTGYNCKPGVAKITRIAAGAKHPYHLVHIDDTTNVYGWVNAANISGRA